MDERQLTVSHNYHRRAREAWYQPESSIPVPYLRFNGLWLAEAGFPIGAKVRVQVEEGRLVVTPAEVAS